jgi:DNA-binding IclR family transcriptional regulator
VQYAAYNSTLHKPVITFAVEGPRRLKVASEVGAVVPVHVTAVGYAIASVLDDEELHACLAACDWDRYAADNEIDAGIFADKLDEVRGKGWAVVERQFFPEQCSIAAPVVDIGGAVHGALAVLLMPGSSSKEKKRIGQAVRETARRLGGNLPRTSRATVASG